MSALGFLRPFLALAVALASVAFLLTRRLDGVRKLGPLEFAVLGAAFVGVFLILGGGYAGDRCREAKALLESCGPLEGEAFSCAPCDVEDAICLGDAQIECARQ